MTKQINNKLYKEVKIIERTLEKLGEEIEKEMKKEREENRRRTRIFREKLEKYGIKYEEDEDGYIIVSLEPYNSHSIDIVIGPYEVEIDSTAFYCYEYDRDIIPAKLYLIEKEEITQDVVKHDREVLKKLYLTLKAILEALGELKEND